MRGSSRILLVNRGPRVSTTISRAWHLPLKKEANNSFLRSISGLKSWKEALKLETCFIKTQSGGCSLVNRSKERRLSVKRNSLTLEAILIRRALKFFSIAFLKNFKQFVLKTTTVNKVGCQLTPPSASYKRLVT
jgi:hypothetical protein